MDNTLRVNDTSMMRKMLEEKIPKDDKKRDYERSVARFANDHQTEAEIKILHTLMDEASDISYTAFFCLATIYRHARNYSMLRELIEKAEANELFRDRVSLKHIRVMYETHSESLYDYDKLLSMAHESACELYSNPGYLHTFANAFATICDNCLSEDLEPLISEWYESALLFVNHAIEMEPEYAKYYSTKARIVTLKNQFEEANQLLLTAIDKEDSQKKDYALLIGNYQYYRTMVSIKKQQWLLMGTHSRAAEKNKKLEQSSLPFQDTHVYAFVSYSSNDSARVLSLIELLRNHGVNIWYDGEIPGGDEWPQVIGTQLINSKTVLLFLSQTALLSRNVRNEILMAQNYNIPIIPIYLEAITLSPGAELQLSGYHAYHYYNMSETAFLDNILCDLSSERIMTDGASAPPEKVKHVVRAPSARKVDILERQCVGKQGIPEKNEDILVETDDFIAVIDGATSKNSSTFSGKTGGRLAAEFIERLIRSNEFERMIDGKTAIVRIQTALREYSKQMNFQDMGIHLCASAVIFSVARKQIWSVGDCQFMINKKLYTFSKKVDEILSQTRALVIQMLIHAGETEESLIENDKARSLILDELSMQKYLENQKGEYGYSVFSDRGSVQDSFIISVPDGAEVILASDGYPTLYSTLEKSEEKLQELIVSDPLCYKKYRSTKGLSKGCLSFDDRTYIRFKLNT